MGRHNAGKTTFLERLLGNIVKVEYNGNTISMDYGRLKAGDITLHFFGTPGQERFGVVRDTIMHGMDMAILIIDSTKGISEFEINLIRKLKKKEIPFVIALNKQDLNRDIVLDLPEIDGVKIVPMIATKGIGVRETVNSLINLLYMEGLK